MNWTNKNKKKAPTKQESERDRTLKRRLCTCRLGFGSLLFHRSSCFIRIVHAETKKRLTPNKQKQWIRAVFCCCCYLPLCLSCVNGNHIVLHTLERKKKSKQNESRKKKQLVPTSPNARQLKTKYFYFCCWDWSNKKRGIADPLRKKNTSFLCM